MTKWLIIGSDQRLRLASDILNTQGYSCSYVAEDSFSDELEKSLRTSAPDRIILPLLSMTNPIPPKLLKKTTVLYTGQTAAQWIHQLNEFGIQHKSYLRNEQFIWKNAQLTAEAFVDVFYEQTKRTIAGKRFYIAGFGRVGKALAFTLNNLQANVTVAARSDEQLAEAAILGYDTTRLTEYTTFTDGYVVNTIPAQWLDPKRAGRIFDVASAPGCLKPSTTSEYYTIHLKLPGIHFPVDAATVVVDAVLRMDSEERGARCLKENESD
ncbi:hypothetical protein DV702_02840 [Sporosarcina sp. PTS2304]|uniref:hypothetical protein n=1 Tax=Sporosarcina sp. PTS2304 TaxID=2283194 RepID=UPI000E0D39FB|nr:hypothetical protein [Sporosarcina sp. PTS2304]AXH98748.1 hypothetical protein DV702_02840 [Sporosarcina sp. PTS2304]